VDQTARIWNIATQTEVGIVGGFGERVSNVEFSADGLSLVLIGGFGQVRVYELSSFVRRGLFTEIDEMRGFSRLALSPDSSILATISIQGTLALWRVGDHTLIRSNSPPPDTRYAQDHIPNIAFAPDGRQVASATRDALRFMDVASGEIHTIPIDGNHEINSVAFCTRQ
jgi:WD40 repeat protein